MLHRNLLNHMKVCAKKIPHNLIKIVKKNHNYFSNSLPPVFDNYFDPFDHQYDTRNGNHTIRFEQHDTEMAAESVGVASAKLWNVLNISYKNITIRKKQK